MTNNETRSKKIFVGVYEFVRYLILLAGTFLIGTAAVGSRPDLLPYGAGLIILYVMLTVWTNKRRKAANES